jgi:hypothetical protein
MSMTFHEQQIGLLIARWFLASPAADVIGITPLGQVEVEGFGYTFEIIAIAIVFLLHSIAFLVYGTRIRRVLLLSLDSLASPAGAAAAAAAASSAINGGIRGPLIAPLTPPSPHSPPLPSSRGGRLHGSGSTNNLLARVPSTGDALHLADDTAAPLLSPPSSPSSDTGEQPGSRLGGTTRGTNGGGNNRRSLSPGESPSGRPIITTNTSTRSGSMLDELSPPSSPNPSSGGSGSASQFAAPRRSSSLASLNRAGASSNQYGNGSNHRNGAMFSTYGSFHEQTLQRHTQPGHHPWRTPQPSSATASSNNLAAIVGLTSSKSGNNINGGNNGNGLWKSQAVHSVANSPLLGWGTSHESLNNTSSSSAHTTPMIVDHLNVDPLTNDIDDGLASRRAMSRKVVLATSVCSFLFAVRCLVFLYYPIIGSFPTMFIDRYMYPYLYYEIPEIVPGLLLLWLTTPSTSSQTVAAARLSAHDML